MKKLFLLLSVGCNIFCMDSSPDVHQEISKKAAPLHRFLTQHLDDEYEDPDYKAVNELADRLNELSLNSSVLAIRVCLLNSWFTLVDRVVSYGGLYRNSIYVRFQNFVY